jgi:hypothetical protein
MIIRGAAGKGRPPFSRPGKPHVARQYSPNNAVELVRAVALIVSPSLTTANAVAQELDPNQSELNRIRNELFCHNIAGDY